MQTDANIQRQPVGMCIITDLYGIGHLRRAVSPERPLDSGNLRQTSASIRLRTAKLTHCETDDIPNMIESPVPCIG